MTKKVFKLSKPLKFHEKGKWGIKKLNLKYKNALFPQNMLNPTPPSFHLEVFDFQRKSIPVQQSLLTQILAHWKSRYITALRKNKENEKRAKTSLANNQKESTEMLWHVNLVRSKLAIKKRRKESIAFGKRKYRKIVCVINYLIFRYAHKRISSSEWVICTWWRLFS